MRVVLDTNVFISAAISKGKSRRLLLKLLRREDVDILISRNILNELNEVIKRPKFRLTEEEISDFLTLVLETVKMINVKSNFKVIKEDLRDNMFLNLAYDGKADHIVSGNRHLLSLKKFKGIKIISVSKTLKLLKR
ncbi:MAG: putative toxin-antitoxin system toxin component, PIN family [Methanosarcinales archaeon]